MKFGLGFLFVLVGAFLSFVPDEARAAFSNPFDSAPRLTTDENTQITDMLETFSPGCSLVGASTKDAIALVKGLTMTLAASKDTQCESVAGVLARMQSAQIRAEGFMPWIHEDVDNVIDQEVAGYQAQKERILALLAQTADPFEIAALKDELRSTELNLARSQGQQASISYSDRRQRQNRALTELVVASNASMDQMLANQACWVNKPNLLREMGAVAIGVGGSVAMATPASETAMLIGAGVQMTAKVIDFFQKFQVQKKINELNLTLSSTAMTCALERMSEIYCSARDTLRAIQTAGKNIHGEDPVWSGVKLLDEDMPIALAWLDNLRSGGGAATPNEASERYSLAIQESQLNESRSYAFAVIDQQEKIYNGLTDPKLRFQTLRNAAVNVTSNGMICSDNGSTGNPMCDVVASADSAGYDLLGVDESDRLKIGAPYQKIFKVSELELQYFAAAGVQFNGSFALMRTQFDEWYRKARERFEIKKSLTVGGDLEITFNKAMPTAKRKGPLVSLYKLRDFTKLEVLNAKSAPTRSHAELRKKLGVALDIIIAQIEGVDEGKIPADKAKDTILGLYRLDRGTSDLRDYIVRLISVQLDWLVYASGQVPNDVVIQWLASNDYVNELRRYRGEDESLEHLVLKAEETQRIIRASIPTFFKTFKAPLANVLPTMPNTSPKALLCFQLLMSAEPNQYFDYDDSCYGLQGKAATEKGVSTPPFSSELFKKKFEDRACIYRDFLRKNMVYQRQEILPGGESRFNRRPVANVYAQPIWRSLLKRSADRAGGQ